MIKDKEIIMKQWNIDYYWIKVMKGFESINETIPILKSKCIECETDGNWIYEVTEDQFQLIQSLPNIEFIFISSNDYLLFKNQRKRLLSNL